MTLLKSIYLAASYARRREIAGYRDELGGLGFTVTSSWLDMEPISDAVGGVNDDGRTCRLAPARQAEIAGRDLEDLAAADLVICFTHRPGEGPSRGGRHVELGVALARAVEGWAEVWIVGPAENVFCFHPRVRIFSAFVAARVELQARIVAAAVGALDSPHRN